MLTSPYKLANFEGPLELLLHLVEQGEINALELILERLTDQLSDRLKESDLDENAESLFLTASLIYLKSQELLPKNEQPPTSEDALKGEIIAKIVELYAIKEKAGVLEECFDTGCYTRGRFYEERSKALTIPTAQELEKLIEKVLLKQKEPRFHVINATWQVKEQASWLKKILSTQKTLSFNEVFAFDQPVMKRIVTFLAALELFRCQEIYIEKRDEGYYFCYHRPTVCSQRPALCS